MEMLEKAKKAVTKKTVMLMACVGAMVGTTGCATYYTNANGEVIYVRDNNPTIINYLNAGANLLNGAANAAHVGAHVTDSVLRYRAYRHHRHHGRW